MFLLPRGGTRNNVAAKVSKHSNENSKHNGGPALSISHKNERVVQQPGQTPSDKQAGFKNLPVKSKRHLLWSTMKIPISFINGVISRKTSDPL